MVYTDIVDKKEVKEKGMKRVLTSLLAVVLAAVCMLGCMGCSEQVDEKDLSRWIIRFSSDYSPDMENGYIEKTAEELQYYVIQIRLSAPEEVLNIEPYLEVWYLNKENKRIALCGLGEGKYQFVRTSLEYYLNDGVGTGWASIDDIGPSGEYSADYAVSDEILREEPIRIGSDVFKVHVSYIVERT